MGHREGRGQCGKEPLLTHTPACGEMEHKPGRGCSPIASQDGVSILPISFGFSRRNPDISLLHLLPPPPPSFSGSCALRGAGPRRQWNKHLEGLLPLPHPELKPGGVLRRRQSIALEKSVGSSSSTIFWQETSEGSLCPGSLGGASPSKTQIEFSQPTFIAEFLSCNLNLLPSLQRCLEMVGRGEASFWGRRNSRTLRVGVWGDACGTQAWCLGLLVWGPPESLSAVLSLHLPHLCNEKNGCQGCSGII